ncbi:MAG: helix-turn-helix domain-containing protein [Bacteroidales bacterium]|nr:helix-turn-helix domain-containing protein [Bacteroidales bacterium]MBQ6100849.1 helix-turn-helix domain-containing protein [Bacteroidales bacterium]
MKEKEFMTVKEVCEEFGISRQWLHHLSCNKKLTHYKPDGGRRLYFKRSDVVNYFTAIKIQAE